MCLLALCIPFLDKCLFRSSAIFNWVVNFFVIMVISCLHTLEIKPLSVASFANDFLPRDRLSFHFVYGFLCCTFVSKVSLIRSHLFIFVFISIAMKDKTYPCQVIDLCPLHLLSLNVNIFHLNILYIFLISCTFIKTKKLTCTQYY